MRQLLDGPDYSGDMYHSTAKALAAEKRLTDFMQQQMNAALPRGCVVCGGRAASAAVMMPNPHVTAAHRAAQGLDRSPVARIYFYAVCEEHDPGRAALPEVVVERERAIQSAIFEGLRALGNPEA
jgi:hypothetical protein